MSNLFLNEFIKIEDQWYFKEDPDSLIAEDEKSLKRINEELRDIIKKQREAVKILCNRIKNFPESDVTHDGSELSCIKFNRNDRIEKPLMIDSHVSLQQPITAEIQELNGQIHKLRIESQNVNDEITKVSFAVESSDQTSVNGSVDVLTTDVGIARNELVDGGNPPLMRTDAFLSHEMKSLPRISSTYVDREEYCMNYSQRGYVVIFNHYDFENSMGYAPRMATEVDCGRLEKTFKQLGFIVEIYPDLLVSQIHATLDQISRRLFRL